MNNILDVYDKLQLGDNQNQTIDFLGKANIWINNTYDRTVIDYARLIITEALKNTTPGQLSVVGYDSDLSGIFSPFASLSAGEAKVLELISGEKEFKNYLDYLWQQIQSVQNVIQGRSMSLYEFRKMTGRPVEGYKLVVLSLDMGIIDNDMRAKIAMLMRNGPAYGVSFLIISTTYITVHSSSGKDIELSVDSIAPNITVLDVAGTTVRSNKGSASEHFYAPKAETIIATCQHLIGGIKTTQLPVISFSELHTEKEHWSNSSIDGLTFSIGKFGVNDMNVTIGDEINQRHNALITGAVGQGKSNLISIIIHSLCYRYSPEELQLFLLDYKEGVTFKPFSNIGQEEYLPHARALGLESDISFGLAVMEYLFAQYQYRMKLLKQYNYRSIRELRINKPEILMPRIVVIIDEFQMMFGDDVQQGQKIADMLEKSVRLYRAAGIHFILASQTLSGNMALVQKRDSIFSQVPIRIALKNSISESQQTLGLNNSSAAFLRPREAVVNLDYGEVTQNRKTVIAFADEKVLQPLRHSWWNKMRKISTPPYVFEGDKRITISKAFDAIGKLKNENSIPKAILGEMISIDGKTVQIPMTNEMGRNIAIIGTSDIECNTAVGMAQSISLSLALQHPTGNARFIWCDFSRNSESNSAFVKAMESAGFFIEDVSPDTFESFIKDLQNAPNENESVYVFGLFMDKWHYAKDPYGQGSCLKGFVENAPMNGIHFIGWWQKASNYNAQTAGFGSTDAFNTKVFLRIDERSVQTLTSPFVRWSSSENRALISDSIEFDEEITFIPFSPIDSSVSNKLKNLDLIIEK